MKFYDTHTHCLHSFDSEAAIDDMIEAAVNAGLPGICFTDHHDIDFPKEYPYEPDALLDIPSHIREIRDKAVEYRKKADVLCGIEIGMQPYLASANSDVIHSGDFDFVIASCHVLYGQDPYYGEIFEGRDESDVYRAYFESTLENINCFDDFDVLGHLDYIVRYGSNSAGSYSYEKFSNIIDDILLVLISKNKGIEINTSGLKSALKATNPCAAIIKRYRELGGEIITVGSDAHTPEFVGFEFGCLTDLLKNAGFDHYNIFRKRRCETIPLS